MAGVNHWTRDQLLVAFTLYSQIPFGKLHSKIPTLFIMLISLAGHLAL